ncbi:MAG: chromosomal replication initiator protein DnaA [Oscillospiraceae bacterium]|nr:chromosomal replication initiator protein DnaA [Oscillospiraceae bacterium]
MNKEEIWMRVIEALKESLPNTVLRAWFDDSHIERMDDDCVVIVTTTGLKRDAIQKRYPALIVQALKQLLGREYNIEVLTAEDAERRSEQPDATYDGASQFTFERFVVGPTNQLAYSAALCVSDGPSKGYNPLFIYGGSGLGKTHLLHAIKNRISQNRPDCGVNIFSSEQFVRDLVAAIESGDRAVFHEKYRFADVLIVDDLQFISLKEFVQEELFHTFNTLYESGHQIVLASDRPPKAMKKLEDRILSRLEWGLVVDIQPPELETRMAILQAKAKQDGLSLPENVSLHIAESITGNVRQLEGSIKKLMAYHELMGMSLSVETASLVVSDLMKEVPAPDPDLIIKRVCDFYGVDVKDMKSNSRRANLVQARQVAMFLIREITQASLNDIAYFVNRDHTTVIHAIDRVKERCAQSPDFEDDLRLLTDNLAAH